MSEPEKKPREFWLYSLPHSKNEWDAYENRETADDIHVIEYSAYSTLLAENQELRRLKDELSSAGQRGVDELAKENQALREKLKKAESQISDRCNCSQCVGHGDLK